MTTAEEDVEWLVGPFPRGVAKIDESDLVFRALQALGTSPSVMIDVGAHFGGSLRPFAAAGWSVHAFEPDPDNRRRLVASFGDHGRVAIRQRAITTEDDATVEFFQSPESTGVSTLSPFLDSHDSQGQVLTRRLDTYMFERKIDHVTYLKVDAEGHDGFLLQSYPFHRDRPDVITCEFEDFKTSKLGYSSGELATWIGDMGYTVLVSQWHPIVRYGISHDFRGVWRYNAEQIDPSTWGNLIAVRRPDLLGAVVASAQFWDLQPSR